MKICDKCSKETRKSDFFKDRDVYVCEKCQRIFDNKQKINRIDYLINIAKEDLKQKQTRKMNKNENIIISAKCRKDPSKHVELEFPNVKEARDANPHLYDFRAVRYVMHPKSETFK